jgi:hypothetical protein
VPWSTVTVTIRSVLRSINSLFSALAAADAIVFDMTVADGLIMKRSVLSASSTGRPRTRSATFRSLEAEIPMLLLYALTAIVPIYLSLDLRKPRSSGIVVVNAVTDLPVYRMEVVLSERPTCPRKVRVGANSPRR